MLLRETWGYKQFQEWEINFRRCVDEVFALLGFTCRKLKIFYRCFGVTGLSDFKGLCSFPSHSSGNWKEHRFSSARKSVRPLPTSIVVPKWLSFLPNFSFPFCMRRLALPVHLSTILVLAIVFHLSVNFLLTLQPDWLFYLLLEPIKNFPEFFLDCLQQNMG